MKDTIYKYAFDPKNCDRQEFTMPHDASPICVQIQDGIICLWAEVDSMMATDSRVFWIVGTGWPLPPPPYKYIGTVQEPPYVWHIYEELRP